MSLIKWEPFGELDSFLGERSPSGLSKLGWDLAVDVYEDNSNVVAKMNMPGVEPDDIEISLEKDILTVSGNREEEKEVKDREYYSKEIRRGSFSRTLTLPADVEAQGATAKIDDGTLTITMPIVEGGRKKATNIPVTGNKK